MADGGGGVDLAARTTNIATIAAVLNEQVNTDATAVVKLNTILARIGWNAGNGHGVTAD